MGDELLSLLQNSGHLTTGVIAYLVFMVRKDLAKINMSILELRLKNEAHGEKIQDIKDKLDAQESKETERLRTVQ